MAKLSHNEIAQSIYLLTKDKSGKELKEVLEKVVSFMERKRLLGKSEAIMSSLQKIIYKKEGIVEVGVRSVKGLSNHAKHELKDGLEKRYHAKEIIWKEGIDESLLGGVRIEVDDEVIDLTLKNKVAKLQEHLTRTI